MVACAVVFDRMPGCNGIKRAAWTLCCMVLVAIGGLRYGVGGDTIAYHEDFLIWYDGAYSELWDNIVWQFTKISYMPLWTGLNICLRELTDNFYIMQTLEAAAINIAVCYILRRHCRYCFTALILYCVMGTYFLFTTEVMREGFALAFGLLAIEAYSRQNRRAYGLYTLLAIGFHLSAILLLLIPWVRIRITRRTVAASAVAALVIWTMSSAILAILSGIQMDGILGVVINKINLYTKAAFNLNGFIRFSLTYLLLPVSVAYMVESRRATQPDTERDPWREQMWGMMVVLGIVAASLGGFDRVLNYVMVYEIIVLAELIPDLLRERRHMLVRFAAAMMLIGLNLSTYFIYWPKNEFYQYQFYFPYTSALDRKPNVEYRKEAHLESSDHGNINSDSNL